MTKICGLKGVGYEEEFMLKDKSAKATWPKMISLHMFIVSHIQSKGLCVKNLVSEGSVNFQYLCLYLQSG